MNPQTTLSPIPSRVLICGLGSIGRRHLRVLREHWSSLDIGILRSGLGPDCEEAKSANHLFLSLDDALAWKPEAAIISTPATDHLRKALPMARLGIPLLIEKPLGAGHESSNDWQELLDLSSKVPISVAYVFRHDPCAIFVKSLLESGKLGKLVEADFYCGSWLPDWRSGLDYRDCVSARRDQGGGVLLELSHELDLAQWLLGTLKLDSALLQQSGLLEIDVEDQAILVARSVDGFSVIIRLNFCTKPARRHLILRGCSGEIQWDLIGSKVQVAQNDSASAHAYESTISPDDRYHLQMKHFLACAMRRVRPMCSLAEGLKTLQLVAQARQKGLALGAVD